jgi:hypothetical protein
MDLRVKSCFVLCSVWQFVDIFPQEASIAETKINATTEPLVSVCDCVPMVWARN